ncbi:MAG: hypothetical protein NZV14_00290 [Bryobacteraceae bacterium]|nr:hypothetical protein [Bryobacteraceae bacterium]MDW8376570.1 hypothetical protein [Bryobacterales bacterium]
MDTRTKIVSPEEARRRIAMLRARGWRTLAAPAYLDPMLPQHISQMARVVGEAKLTVVIATPEDAFLPAQARAELAASLSFVDLVVIGNGDPHHLAQSLGVDQTVSLLELESLRRKNFVEYVKERVE